MSDVERPWVERRRSGPPSSCPVCGAATMYVGIAGVLTCRSAAGDHFEWRPDEPAAVRVESERADEWKCSWCRGHNPATETRCRFCDIEPVASVTPERVDAEIFEHIEATNRELRPTLEASADIAPPPLTEAEAAELPDGTPVTIIWTGGNGPHDYVISVDADGTRCAWNGAQERLRFYNRLRFVGQERFHTRVWLRDEPPATAALEGEIMGRDFVETAERRLHPDAAALASLHRPVYGRPPYCWACSSGGRGSRVDSSRRAVWPCSTAELALEMMGLTPSDIAITEE